MKCWLDCTVLAALMWVVVYPFVRVTGDPHPHNVTAP